MPKKILFLYSEIATYFLACLNQLNQDYDVEIHLVRWAVNPEAPFQFEIPESFRVYERNDYNKAELLKLSQKIQPDLIFCTGWIDKDYIQVCKQFKSKIPTIAGIDNHWFKRPKQYLAALLSPFTLKRYFSHIFVPGKPQYEYAKVLGFKDAQILWGFYSADYDYFNELYLENKTAKYQNFPKKIIYVGRYYDFKGIKDLWQAFIELQDENPNDWELWCLGTGDLQPKEHPKIKHFGFVQPKDMKSFIAQTGVFVLPSHFEPWGVVVHEYATAGFPILCSKAIGAASMFLEEGKNGFFFQSKNKNDLKKVLAKTMALPQEKLIQMAETSVEKAKKITPKKWAKTLMELSTKKI